MTRLFRSLSVVGIAGLGAGLFGAVLAKDVAHPTTLGRSVESSPIPRKHWECDLHRSHAIPIFDPATRRDTLIDTIPDVGVITTVPEFHDCQRFILFRGNTVAGYDSVYAIWAVLKLRKLWASLTALDAMSDTATLQLPQDSIRVSRAKGNFDSIWAIIAPPLRARAARKALLGAVILSIGGEYKRLGIQPGFNCLYLHSTRAPRAKIVAQGRALSNCPDTIWAGLTGVTVSDLNVDRQKIDGLQPADFPAVARWEWDARKKEQFIGLMCDAWCFIGPAPVVSPKYPSGQAGDPPKKRRVIEAWGWFDEQLLAEPPWGVVNGIGPSAILGTILPDSGLYAYKQADFQNQWRLSARVSLSAASTHYKSRMNFVTAATRVPLSDSVTTIELCKGDQCSRVPDTLEASCNWPSNETKPAPSERWWAKITSATGNVVYKCVVRREHSDLKDETGAHMDVPGTARWHWILGDETTWKRCDNGCCDVIP